MLYNNIWYVAGIVCKNVWLCEHAPNHGALNLLAEFAYEAENAFDVTRVQTLLIVGTSYEPLIHNIYKVTGYEALLGRMCQVFQNLKQNEKIADKLVSHLELQ